MFEYFRTAFSSENDQDPDFVKLVRTVLSFSVLGTAVLTVIQFLTYKQNNGLYIAFVIGGICALTALSLFLNYRNILWPGKVLIPLSILIAMTYLGINANGLHDSSVTGFTLVILFTALVAGQKAIPVATVLTLLGVWTVAYVDISGVNPSGMAQKSGWDDIAAISIVQILAGVALNALLTRIQQALTTMRLNEQEQVKTNQELRQLQTVLENRIDERTHSLELAAEVGRAISEVRALDVMLEEAAEIIRSRFDLYYTQVYLVNPSQTDLLLQAGTGTVGQELVQREHRLPLNTGSINGRAAVEKQSLVIADTKNSATFRPNPLLPDTKSEMAVPLLVGGRVLGVLDLQSRKAGELNQDMLPAFEALAGQLAVAIQNASLLEEANQARAEVEAQSRRLVSAGWTEFMDAIHKPEQISYAFQNEEIVEIGADANITGENAIAVPIEVGGEILGTLAVEIDKDRLTPRKQELIRLVSRQVAQQIENQRLLESAQRYRFEAEQASRRMTREGWLEYMQDKEQSLGYVYDLKEVKPAARDDVMRDMEDAVTLPLKVRDETVGKFAIQGLSDDDSESVTFANQVVERLSAHIESLRQYGQTQSALAQSEKLFEASRKLTLATDPQDLIDSAIHSLGMASINRALMGTFRYSTANELEGMSVSANWWDGTGPAVEAVGKFYSVETLSRSGLLTSETPVFISDIETDPKFEPNRDGIAREMQCRAVAIMPLFLGATHIGVMVLKSDQVHVFSQDEIRLFSALAPQIATVLENRRQYERARQQAERESMLNTINQKIQSATSVEAVLQIAARELGHALGAPRAVAQLSIKEKK